MKEYPPLLYLDFCLHHGPAQSIMEIILLFSVFTHSVLCLLTWKISTLHEGDIDREGVWFFGFFCSFFFNKGGFQVTGNFLG